MNKVKTEVELTTKVRHDDAVAIQKTENSLNEIIRLMEYNEVEQASNYLRNRRRVLIDQSCENKELFNELLATGVKMFNATRHSGDENYLGICQVRCRIRNNVKEEELENLELFTNCDVQIDDDGKTNT